jgi:hypothetical protein
LLGHASLATTGIYTRLADEMTREIALQTPTAVDGMEGKLSRERPFSYGVEFGGFLESLFG